MAQSMSGWRCGNCAAGSIWRGLPGPAARPRKRCRIAGDGPRGRLGAADPWCAPKAVSAAVAAEQARRKLNEETGKYLLADQISSNWAKTLGVVLRAIDEGLAQLDLLLSLDEEGIAVLRKRWRYRRAGLADRLGANAAAVPEFLEDIAA